MNWQLPNNVNAHLWTVCSEFTFIWILAFLFSCAIPSGVMKSVFVFFYWIRHLVWWLAISEPNLGCNNVGKQTAFSSGFVQRNAFRQTVGGLACYTACAKSTLQEVFIIIVGGLEILKIKWWSLVLSKSLELPLIYFYFTTKMGSIAMYWNICKHTLKCSI